MANRWRLITAFALVGAATQLVWLTYAPVTTVAAAHFGVSEAAVGWLANMFPLLYVVLAVPAGVLLDRWFRPALIAGAVLTAIGADLRLLHDGFAVALLGQTVVAVAQPLVLNAITGIAGHYLGEKDRATGIAVGTASTFAGMAAAFVLGAIFPGEHQLGTLTALGAGFATVAAVLLTLELLRAGRMSEGRSPAVLPAVSADSAAAAQLTTGSLAAANFAPGESADPAPGSDSAQGAPAVPGTDAFGGTAAGVGSPLTVLRATLRDRYVRRLCAAVFFPFGTFVALATYGQALLEPAGVSADAASVALLINVVAGVLGCAVVPVAVLRRGAELPAVMVGLTASALACLLVAVAPGLATGFLAFVLIGLTLLPALPIVLAMAERHTGTAEGTAAGLIWMSGNLGGLVVAGATGLLVDLPALAFGLCGAATLLGVPMVRLLRPEPVPMS
ncbi:MFS transporter [Nocardia neocaledoniensis]|uniref:MFS transporter n=1 Tax=Nocardia neocaledoniensis TaxID=236511 RepID=UPI0024575D58|nr:MFS transporter [Nocardia neocaledoniensis]